MAGFLGTQRWKQMGRKVRTSLGNRVEPVSKLKKKKGLIKNKIAELWNWANLIHILSRVINQLYSVQLL